MEGSITVFLPDAGGVVDARRRTLEDPILLLGKTRGGRDNPTHPLERRLIFCGRGGRVGPQKPSYERESETRNAKAGTERYRTLIRKGEGKPLGGRRGLTGFGGQRTSKKKKRLGKTRSVLSGGGKKGCPFGEEGIPLLVLQ